MIYMGPAGKPGVEPMTCPPLPLERSIPALYPFWEGGFPCQEWYISAH
jgi:hypothetical protein